MSEVEGTGGNTLGLDPATGCADGEACWLLLMLDRSGVAGCEDGCPPRPISERFRKTCEGFGLGYEGLGLGYEALALGYDPRGARLRSSGVRLRGF